MRDVPHRRGLLPCRDVLLVGGRAQAPVRSRTCLICRMALSSNGGAWNRTAGLDQSVSAMGAPINAVALSTAPGRLTLNVEPGPGIAEAHIRPSCASIIERQIDSPMPMPSALVV